MRKKRVAVVYQPSTHILPFTKSRQDVQLQTETDDAAMASMPTALRENEGKTRRDRQLEYVLLRFLSAAAASGFPDIRSRLLVSAPPPSFSRRGAALSRTLVSLSLCPPRSSSPPSRQPHPWAIGNFHCTDGRRLPPLQPVFSRLSGRKLSFPGLSLLFLCVYLYLSLALSVCPSLSFSPTFLVPLQPL